jgi:hypothetical protein
MRFGIRVAVAFVTLGMLLGGTMVLLGLTGASDQTMASAIDDAQPDTAVGGSALDAMQVELAVPAASEAGHGSSHQRDACNDLVSSFLDHACRSTEPRKRHAERVNHKVATFVIGRVEAPPAESAPEQPADNVVAAAPTPSIPLPVARPTITAATKVAAQKPKSAQSRDLDPTRKDAAITAYAQADNGPNGGSPRNIGFPLPFGGLFGLR